MMGYKGKATTSVTSLCSLPRDILFSISDILQRESPTSLSSLSLVNSQLHRLAQYCQHQHVRIEILGDTLIKRCAIIESNGLEAAVRQLTLVDIPGGNMQPCSKYRQHIDMIGRVLPRFTGLKSLDYRGNSVPAAILSILAPQVTLSATFPGSPKTSPADELLMRLYNNENLSTLNVQFTWIHESECRRIMRHLKEVILTCPNLKSLTLDVSQPTSGCVPSSQPIEYVGLGFEYGEKIAPLEELILLNYGFGRASRSPTSDVPSDVTGIVVANEIDYWVESFDWSRLKKLKTGYEKFALKAASQFTALEEVHILNSWRNPTMHEFLNQVANSLRTISAPTLRQVSLDGLMCHAGTLETLRLHRAEDHQGTWQGDCIDLDSLGQLQSGLPCLRELSVDIARSGRWPLTVFDAFAGFNRLRILDIWFELGLQDFEHPVEPQLTFDTARDVCEYLRSRCPKLQRMHLHSGHAPPIGFGFPSVQAFWPEQNSTSFVCERSERDDAVANDRFIITCPRLEQREKSLRREEERERGNRKPIGAQLRNHLHKTFKPTSYRRRKTAEDAFSTIGRSRRLRNEASLVAQQGPTPVSLWEGHYW
ncbi:hypothetical protein M409DRAFT_30549 [Zasmidium cellare ATCC 36951]|uniref:F-box domain-containing protein n=1 Tax=Zasmidium cellare ATCC 36951 TaxID=1080233 RepID=A0A6A6BVZ9_ZASCE|nr:uncharacterized protein M409DRAFT_30549 [Zasmidium cellare ATCC 36951]KAF2159014.1 hypothetical protein M409DRAFT_30549 [Zasmidium cellare ATCC 36951]